MIQSLRINNYAIIEELELCFAEGLTIITGETGAGKSILLGALGLIMGKRADSKALYNPSIKCTIEGHFEAGDLKLDRFFEQRDLDYDDHIVVRRELSPSGKSRAFINDTPVTLDVLQALTAQLVDLHQQFDTLDIHQADFQLQLIDALAGNKVSLQRYQVDFDQFQSDKRRLHALEQADAQASKEVELLQFQYNELLEAQLSAGQQEKLEQELAGLEHAEAIKRHAGAAHQALTEDELAFCNQLQELANTLQPYAGFNAKLSQAYERFQGLIYELQDNASEFADVSEQTDLDPERLQLVQDQLDAIYKLQHKHQVSQVEDLLAIQQQMADRLANISDTSAEINQLRTAIQQQETQLLQEALQLRESRKAVLSAFEKDVVNRLRELHMPHVRFEVQLMELETLSRQGLDETQYLFSANKGIDLQPIRDVASGGELARLSLVIKSLVAKAIPLPTLIFDEIDTGVSGDVALRMGKILRQLSDEHQVVSITHSPQIAAKADEHYFVFKKVKDERTVTNVRKLTIDERVRAIAVMLSSNPPSESALENARELIGA